MQSKPWDEIFREKGKFFLEPHKDITNIGNELIKRKAKNVLDLGCGSGRHLVYLVKKGFSMFGLDNSSEGLAITRKWLDEERLSADLQLHDMTADRLPYESSFFDAVISVQVIHHATIDIIQKVVNEMARILKKDGFIFITVPKLRNQGTTFSKIETNTYIPLDGPEKGLPHHYFSIKELRKVFKRFNINEIYLDDTLHYCLTAVKS